MLTNSSPGANLRLGAEDVRKFSLALVSARHILVSSCPNRSGKGVSTYPHWAPRIIVAMIAKGRNVVTARNQVQRQSSQGDLGVFMSHHTQNRGAPMAGQTAKTHPGWGQIPVPFTRLPWLNPGKHCAIRRITKEMEMSIESIHV
jgi:hypothetical protein